MVALVKTNTLMTGHRLRGQNNSDLPDFTVDRFILEATMGIEPMVRVLQTLALPLGDVATCNVSTAQSYATCYELSMEIGPCLQKKHGPITLAAIDMARGCSASRRHSLAAKLITFRCARRSRRTYPLRTMISSVASSSASECHSGEGLPSFHLCSLSMRQTE